jgi:ArsR family metal-binding transcriptional regulator
MAKKEVLNKKVYTIEIIEYVDGSATMNRINDGFKAVELMGQLEVVQFEILEQMKGLIKPPTKVNRKVIKN